MPDRPVLGYLVDTNVISRKSADENAPERRWLALHAPFVRISAISVAEMRRGLVLKQRKLDTSDDLRVKRREQPILDAKFAWYRTLRTHYGSRIEPIDAEVAERWADVSVAFPSLRDGDKALLATALVRGLSIATRNLRDFGLSGVALVNPFDPASWDDEPG